MRYSPSFHVPFLDFMPFIGLPDVHEPTPHPPPKDLPLTFFRVAFTEERGCWWWVPLMPQVTGMLWYSLISCSLEINEQINQELTIQKISPSFFSFIWCQHLKSHNFSWWGQNEIFAILTFISSYKGKNKSYQQDQKKWGTYKEGEWCYLPCCLQTGKTEKKITGQWLLHGCEQNIWQKQGRKNSFCLMVSSILVGKVRVGSWIHSRGRVWWKLFTVWQAEQGWATQPSAAHLQEFTSASQTPSSKDSTAFLNHTTGWGLSVSSVSLWRHCRPSYHVLPQDSRELAFGCIWCGLWAP